MQNFEDPPRPGRSITCDTVSTPNQHALGAERKVFCYIATSTNAAVGQHGCPLTYFFGDSLDDASGIKRAIQVLTVVESSLAEGDHNGQPS